MVYTYPCNETRKSDNKISNFSWVIPNVLAGCAEPGRNYFKTQGSHLYDNLDELYNKGIRCLVSLEKLPENAYKLCEKAGLMWLYYPIQDFSTPEDIKTFSNMVKKVSEIASDKTPVCVHCGAGIGRTGMVLSCIVSYMFQMKSGDSIEAIDSVRSSFDTLAQRDFVKKFCRRMKIK